MPERRQAASSTSSSRSNTGVRRNLFHQHLSRRPTTSSTSTSAETLHLDAEHDSETSDIVIRDHNGDFEVADPPMISEPADGDHEEALEREDNKERKRLMSAVKDHQREKHRAPSEPAELLEAVRNRLRASVAALSEDNWRYEAEQETLMR